MGEMVGNVLYFGDNLDILGEYVEDESVDLIYLDPPFNSRAQYNLLFERPGSDLESAQAGAFRDTWTWGADAEWSYKETMKLGGSTARIVDALRSALHESDMMAYLCMMTIRLHALHKKLKTTGSLYLHCDATAAHYLKIVLDGIFGTENFRSEITWKRTTSHGNVSRNYGAVADHILFYTRSDDYTWNQAYSPFEKAYIEEKFRGTDSNGRRWQSVTLRNPSVRPNLRYPYKASNGKIYQPHPNGWSCDPERMRKYDREDRLHFPEKDDGKLRLKMYLDESPGVKVQNIWSDIPAVNSQAQERIGYPTQKPLALLERIIHVSSNAGDLVLDPFCGCGTTIEAAQQAGRQWIGIDVAVHAIKIIEARLEGLADRIGADVKYRVEGMPRDFESAKRLAEKDKYQFQWWANYLFNPHALREQKRGADRGIDGELFFPNGPGRPWGKMLTSVKGGENVGPSAVRDFARVLDREKAEMGLFICLYAATRAMTIEATSLGFADIVHGDIPRLQIVSIEEWFRKKVPILPPLEHLEPTAISSARRRSIPKSKRPDPTQPQLPLSFTGGKSAEIERHFNPGMVKTWAEKQPKAVSRRRDTSPTEVRGRPQFDYPLPGGHTAARQQVFLMEEPLLTETLRSPSRRRRK